MRYFPLLASALVLSILTAPAFASSGKSSAEKSEKKGGTKPTNQIELPVLVAPMAQGGKLQSYAFLNPVLHAGSSEDLLKIRDKTPYLQDAFLRDVNSASIIAAADASKVDVPGLQKRLLVIAQRLLGERVVKTLTFAKIAITPVAPGELSRTQEPL